MILGGQVLGVKKTFKPEMLYLKKKKNIHFMFNYVLCVCGGHGWGACAHECIKGIRSTGFEVLGSCELPTQHG